MTIRPEKKGVGIFTISIHTVSSLKVNGKIEKILKKLFDRNRLRQVPRLINIAPAHNGDVIGK